MSALDVIVVYCDVLVPIWSALHVVKSNGVDEFMLNCAFDHASIAQAKILLTSYLTNARGATATPMDSDIVGV